MMPLLEAVRRAVPTRRLVLLLGLLTAGALAAGVAFATAVPIIGALFASPPRAPWTALVVLVAAAVVHGLLLHLSIPVGNRVGADLVTSLIRAVARTVSSRPARDLDGADADRLRLLSSYAVVVLMGLPAHVMRPLVGAVVTPLTVLVALTLVAPVVAVVVAVGLLVALAVSVVAVSLRTRSEERDAPAWFRRLHDEVAGTAQRRRRSPLVRGALGAVLPVRAVEMVLCGAAAAAAAYAGGPVAALTAVVLTGLLTTPLIELTHLVTTLLNAGAVLRTVADLIDGPASDLTLPVEAAPRG